MAFNFNWSPLAADTHFYNRAKDLLTRALNKSPKPPIIVDDILVSDFNLGCVPPDLEILEIGDLAEDRFRGIFKMCYSGDASVTLKTRVQVCGASCFLSCPSDHCGGPSLMASGAWRAIIADFARDCTWLSRCSASATHHETSVPTPPPPHQSSLELTPSPIARARCVGLLSSSKHHAHPCLRIESQIAIPTRLALWVVRYSSRLISPPPNRRIP